MNTITKYITFENTYGDFDDDGNEFITIDGYPEDDNAEGTVIATVFRTSHNDIVVSWHHNAYRSNDDVLELIKDSKARLLTNKKPDPVEIINQLRKDYTKQLKTAGDIEEMSHIKTRIVTLGKAIDAIEDVYGSTNTNSKLDELIKSLPD